MTNKDFHSFTLVMGAVAALSLSVSAQQNSTFTAGPEQIALIASDPLPESPGSVNVTETGSSSRPLVDVGAQPQAVQSLASRTDKYIAPGQTAPQLTVGNKIALGVKDSISPFSAIGWAVSAGYAQGLNNSPNYGTNGKAFAQRLGASAARATSEGIFSDSIMASLLREDPRYYRLGPGHSVLHRLVYAGTRTLITRTDSGRATPNLALLAGNLGGSYLTKAYYPTLNRSNTEVFKTFGGSIGGSALGFVVSEFLSGAFNVFHGSKPAAN